MQRKTVKRASPAASKAAAGVKSPSRKSVPAKHPPARPKNILTAGIRALSDAHEQAVARQGRVFESLLGIGQPQDTGAASAALDPFGFRKFEDVFDQRVARSLQHLDVPTLEAFAQLKADVERLKMRIAALEAPARKR